jgi:6,7-dimethyl-8-ribityllumazine synthase
MGVPDDSITVVWVPGSFEIPLSTRKMAESKKFDAIIALGCVIRGGTTPHFEYIAAETTKGIGQVSLDNKSPCYLWGINDRQH